MHEITIRQTKMVSQCAVGSICRAGDECFVICDTTMWTTKDGKVIGNKIPIVRQHLMKKLNNLGFYDIILKTPPVLRSTPDGKIVGDRIPTMRFPSWMVCLKCRKLHHHPWTKKLPHEEYIKSVSELKCDNIINGKSCNGALEYTSYVLISKEGYLDDIPWEYLSHRSVSKKNKRCEHRDKLYLERNKKTNRLQIRCKNKGCGHEEPIEGIRKGNFFTWYKSMNKQPWYKEYVEIAEPPLAVTITDVNVHITPFLSVLDIPPESNIPEDDIHCKLQQHEKYEDLIVYENKNQPLLLQDILQQIARDCNSNTQEIQNAYRDLIRGWPNLENQDGEINDEIMRFKEFKALTIPAKFEKYARFITKHLTKDWVKFTENKNNFTANVIDKLVAVEKLKEIQVFRGFNRYSQSEDNIIYPDLGTAKSNKWLPACELYGEGLFFTLKEDVLKKWENQDTVCQRAEIIEKRKQNSTLQYLPKATPRFLLLHTLSHLIIRELEFSSGYPVSSLNEKIYCSCNPKTQMNGILIYLAVPSKLGSLGGLINQCKPEMFYRLWHKALDRAQFCSYDPICAEHEGQGVEQLNRAACHGCLLLPEITCENNNCLLDRQFLIKKDWGFVNFIGTEKNG